MDDRVLADLGPDERKLLGIFARYGRDGRAITTASLTAHAGFGLDRKRLSEALRKLAGRGLITEEGTIPLSARRWPTGSCDRSRQKAQKSARAGPQTSKRGIDNVATALQRYS